MYKIRWTETIAVFSLLLLAVPAYAGVPASEVAKLDGELTPLGAIRGANADGTIPAWDGGVTKPPAGYKPGMHHVDPFASDKVLFTITSANLAQYSDKLSPGQVAMFERYPDTWKMNIYPTRRSAGYADFVYEAAKQNAASASLTEGGNGVKGARVTSPFPIPQQGVEAIWNHLMRYRGKSIHRTTRQAAPTSGGSYTLITIDEQVLFPYADVNENSESIGNRLAYFLQTVSAPARLAGNLLLVHETLDQVSEPRKAWVYNPGQRRVRRAPNVAYDNPGTASDGQRTNDQLDLFNGAPDRYQWDLKGRKEMYVAYNAYKLHGNDLKYDDILQSGHINPDHLRYELHRVWEVDANVREGTSHIYDRRVFFFDEDSWQAVLVDQYDERGQIWRLSEAHCISYYDVPIFWDTLQCHFDLQNGRYLVYGLNNEDQIDEFGLDYAVDDFSPSALRRLGRR